jgi:hypothetical protein
LGSPGRVFSGAPKLGWQCHPYRPNFAALARHNAAPCHQTKASSETIWHSNTYQMVYWAARGTAGAAGLSSLLNKWRSALICMCYDCITAPPPSSPSASSSRSWPAAPRNHVADTSVPLAPVWRAGLFVSCPASCPASRPASHPASRPAPAPPAASLRFPAAAPPLLPDRPDPVPQQVRLIFYFVSIEYIFILGTLLRNKVRPQLIKALGCAPPLHLPLTSSTTITPSKPSQRNGR